MSKPLRFPLRKGICSVHGKTDFYYSGVCRACTLKTNQRIGRDYDDAKTHVLVRFYGVACKKCGGLLHYTLRPHECVACKLANTAVHRKPIVPTEKDIARVKNVKYYIDSCPIHGESKHYVRNGFCHICHCERTRFFRRWNKQFTYIKEMRARGIEPTPLLITRVFPETDIPMAVQLLAVKLKAKNPSHDTGE